MTWITWGDAAALFMLGLLGTGHCIGMCGPLVVALPGQARRLSAHLVYHAGRLTTYAFIGAVMGAAGSGMRRLAAVVGGDPMLWMSRVQVGIGLVAGVFLFAFGLSRMGFLSEPRWLAIAVPQRMPGWRGLTTKAVDQRSNTDLFLMGLILGGLPCGLSYAAFARALADARMLPGAAMTLIFGVGTLPGLLTVGVGAAVFFRRYRRLSDILAGLIMLGMAATLIVGALESI